MTKIDDLTLMLLYLTSWTENDQVSTDRRSWKGYDFASLNKLTDKEFLYASSQPSHVKSVHFTDEGEKKAKELLIKYHIQQSTN